MTFNQWLKAGKGPERKRINVGFATTMALAGSTLPGEIVEREKTGELGLNPTEYVYIKYKRTCWYFDVFDDGVVVSWCIDK